MVVGQINSIKSDQNIKPRFGKMVKQAINYYEHKLYKKGIKECNNVLKVYPFNSEATCIKGLLLFSIGKKEEGSNLTKKGIGFNVKSSVSWHVYGLLRRLEKNLNMAIKCYQNAKKIDPSNILITRDLSILQLQTNDVKNFQKNSLHVLKLLPGNKTQWIASIVAVYLNNDFDKTKEMLKTYLTTLDTNKVHKKIEIFELKAFEAKVHKKSGSPQEYLCFLEENDKILQTDRLFYYKQKTKVLLELGKHKKCENCVLELLKIDPNDAFAHETLIKLQKIDDFRDENYQFLKENVEKILGKWPKLTAATSFYLDFLRLDDFKQYFENGFERIFKIANFWEILKGVLAANKVKKQFLKNYLNEKMAKFDEVENNDKFVNCVLMLCRLYCSEREYVKAEEFLENKMAKIGENLNMNSLMSKIKK
ncbi:hypothetical protein MHBO_001958, partial [Bonamia ostreae]